MGRINDLLNKRYQKRTRRLPAVVQRVPLDANGRTLGYILCKIGSQNNIKVYTGLNDVYYPGDYLSIEQHGEAAAADYVAVSYHGGIRPDSGIYEFSGETTITDGEAGPVTPQTFAAGDLVFGNPNDANWWFDYSSGIMYLRSGASNNGNISSSGTITLGASNVPYLFLSSSGVSFIDSGSVMAGMSASSFYIGASSGTNGLFYSSGSLIVNGIIYANSGSFSGTILADSGTIGGFNIGSGSLTSASIGMATQAGNDTYAFWAGSDDPATAEFSVRHNGLLTADNAYINGTVTAANGTIVINEDGFRLSDTDIGAGLILNEVKDVFGTGTGDFGLRIYDDTGVYHISLLGRTGNVPFFRLGSQDAESWLQWDENGLVLKGDITATNGSISGTLYVGNEEPRILIDGIGKLIESTNYHKNVSGFRLDGITGSVEFEDITARGAIKTAVFQKSLITAFAGSQVVSKSASTVAVAVTLSGTTFPLIVKAQDGAPFADGDLIYIKTETLATYAIVNAGTASGDNWAYTATYHSGSDTGTIPAGSTVVDYGPGGAGRIYQTADAENAPYLSIATHDMAAPPVWTERVRLGNLEGLVDGGGYGLWTDNGWFTGMVTASVIRSAATGARIEMNTEKIFGVDDTGTEQWYAQATDGKLYAGQGAVVLDSDGLHINSSDQNDNNLAFTSGGYTTGFITGWMGQRYTGDTGGGTQFRISTYLAGTSETSEVELSAAGENQYENAYLKVTSGGGGEQSRIYLSSDSIYINGDLEIHSGLKVYDGANTYTGYISVPLTSSRRNNTYFGSSVALSVGTYYPDLHDANYNLPAGIRGIYCRLSAKWGAAGDGNIAIIRPKGGSDAAVVARAQAANIHIDSSGFVPCDANGDIEIQIMGATTTAFWLDIWGYVI